MKRFGCGVDRRKRLSDLIFAGIAIAWFVSGQEAISLRMIVVATPEEAARVQVELKGGADFAVLAREKSIDATAVDGGLMANVDPGALRAELREAIAGVKAAGCRRR